MIIQLSTEGDFYGSKFEFNPCKDEEHISHLKATLDYPDFKITDDSILTVATAKWLLVDPAHTKAKLIEIYKDFARRYPSSYGTMFYNWAMSNSVRPYNSCGNGSAMRVAPVGWVATSLNEALHLAKITAEVTHNHPEGIKGAQAVAAVIFLQHQGWLREDICSFITNKFGYDLSRSYDEIKRTYKFEGTCQKTVPEAITVWREFAPDCYERGFGSYSWCITKAIALGGDADTLACITGSMCVYCWDVIHSRSIIEHLPIEFINIGREFDNYVFNKIGIKVPIPDEYKILKFRRRS